VTKYESALLKLDRFLFNNSIEYVVIGGVAVIIHGYQRTTNDIDITILCDLEDLDKIHNLFESEFHPAFQGTLEYFKRNFILPVDEPENNLRIDIAAGLTEFDKSVIKRKVRKKIGEAEVFVCSLEDLIIYKLFARREQDIADVKNLLGKNEVDKKYLLETANKFKELERGDILENLNKFLQDVR
jgi:predicted nucleotidyltransferase